MHDDCWSDVVFGDFDMRMFCNENPKGKEGLIRSGCRQGNSTMNETNCLSYQIFC